VTAGWISGYIRDREDDVEDSPHRDAPRVIAPGLGRRQFMRKAAVAGAIAWTVPTIVSIQPAGAAERHSAPPVKPVGGVKQHPGTVDATQKHTDPVPQLPFTGDNEIVEMGVGIAAVAGGAAMLFLSGGAERAALDVED
jgi:hypothetical protein